MHGFLCTVKEPVDEINWAYYKKNKMPLPLIKKYASGFAFFENIKDEDISVHWGVGGEVVLVLIRNKPHLMILKNKKKSFSKSLNQNCQYGNMWDEGLFEKYFATIQKAGERKKK